MKFSRGGRQRPVRRVAATVVALACLGWACGGDEGNRASGAGRKSVRETWVLGSPAAVPVPPPPAEGSAQARAEAEELVHLARQHGPLARLQVRKWSDHPAVAPWVEMNLDLVRQKSRNPPRAARGYALMSVAVNDAVASAGHWQGVYKRPAPTFPQPVVPARALSYPSEHAAMAGAASRVLAYLFPDASDPGYDRRAEEAAESRLLAATNYRSDVEAGLALGREVADRVIARAKADGADAPDAAPEAAGPMARPRGPGAWEPPPGTPEAAARPLEPRAGTWRSWVPSLVQKVRPGPPPAFGSPEFVAEAREVVEVGRRLTPQQKEIALRWAGGPGTSLPPGLWNEIALAELRRSRMTIPQTAQVLALLNVALADAAVAAWDCKYAYWSPRPVNAVRDMGLDPGWKPLLGTPVFPAYISGHSTFSAAAAEVLSQFFPEQRARFQAMAREAAESRLYAGIHYRTDNQVGLEVGRKVGRLVLATAGLGARPERSA